MKLADLYSIRKGKKPGTLSDLGSKTHIRFIQIEDLRSDNELKYCLPSNDQLTCKEDDLLIVWDGAYSGLISSGLAGAFGSTLARLRPFTNEAFTPYVSRYLQSRLPEIQQNRTGATIPHVNGPHLKDLDIPLPPLEKQKRIAAILDKADAVRRKRAQSLELADQFLKSAFLDMFGDPVTNPKGWPSCRLSKHGEVTTGSTPSRKHPEYYGNQIEWIKSDNINTPGHILSQAEEGLSEKGFRICRWVAGGSTLVTCIAGSPSCIGNCAFTDRQVAFNQQINAITPFKETDPHFLYCLVLLSKRAIQAASTSAMKGMVSKSRFSKVQSIRPPADMQANFGLLTRRCFNSVEPLKNAERGAQALFHSLTQRAFRGKL